MKNFTLRSWLASLCQRGSSRPRHASLDVEILEDRDTPSASLLAGAATLMNPTYQLFQSQVKLSSPSGVGSLASPAGYSPAQIRTAYGINKITFQGTVAGDGTGETIAIVDAFDDPTAATDLTAFDQEFGLPAANFTKVGINAAGAASTSTFPTPDPDWSIEIALDVEWSHAIAPKANILLVEANTNSYADLMTAVDYARHYTGVTTVSMSWGGSEFPGETAYASYFTTPAGHPGVTFFASAGDSGTPAIMPSVLGNVVAVGGTSLTLDSAGNWQGESGWSEGGGGISTYVSQPTYQDNLTIFDASANGMRAVPDVAYNADPYTGVAVLSTYGYGGWLQVGGTSAGSPQWAAILAITDQGRALAGEPSLDGATQTLPDLYDLPSTDFHDITTGNNGLPAGPGYDLVTGLGSPVANFVVPDLVGVPQVLTSIEISPANATVGDNNQEQFLAVALDQFGKPMISQPIFTWSVISGQGSVDANGLYTAPSTGSGSTTLQATITVNNGVFSSTSTLSYLPGPSIAEVGASPSVVTGTWTTLSAQVSDVNPASLTYIWWVVNQPAGANAPDVETPASATTIAIFTQAGAYEFEFEVTDAANATATAIVDVTVSQTLTNIVVSATTFTLTNGATLPLTATAQDQFARPLAVQPAFAWSVVSGLGMIDANGVYTSPAAGSGTDTVSATASVNGVTLNGTAAVGYGAGLAITSINANPSILTGTTTTVSANVFDPGASYIFTFWYGLYLPAGGVEPLFTDATSPTTTATFFGPGTYTLSFMAIDAAGNMAEATMNVTVAPTLTTVMITPIVAYLADGAQQQFTAQALDQFFTPMSSTFSWGVTKGAGTIDANGLYTAPAVGSGATYIEATATVNNVTVNGVGYAILTQPPTVTSIGAAANPVNGVATTLNVAAVDPNGGTLTYLWTVTGQPTGAPAPALGTPMAAGTKATFYQAGSYTFQVAVTDSDDLTTLATLTVTVNSVPTSMTMTPPTVSVADGSVQQFTPQAFDQFHQPMAAPFTWSMVTGSGSVNASGLYTAPLTGTGSPVLKASASMNGGTVSAASTVTLLAPPSITTISATPTPVNGSATTLKVAATNPGGGNPSYAWSVLSQPTGAPTPTFSAAATSTTIATFYRAGIYKFQAAVTNARGQTTLATVSVTVNAVLTSIVMTPTTATVLDGNQQQFSASAFDQFQQPLAVTFAWSMASGLGTVNTAGLYKAPTAGAGAAVVKASATLNGVTSSRTATVTLLAPPTVTSITATPAVVTGTTTSLKVVAVNPNGGSLAYAWSVLTQPAGASAPTFSAATASITNATFYQAGSYAFQVAVTNQVGQTTLAKVTVTVNPEFTSVMLSPTITTIQHGLQQQFTAVALNQFHNALANQTVAWSVTGLGTISSSGLYQAPAAATGAATINAKVTVNGFAIIASVTVNVI